MINKKIIFMGTPEIASIYLDSLIINQYNIIAVYSQPPKKKGRGMKVKQSEVHKLALLHNIDVFTPSNFFDNSEKNNLERLKPDLIIVMAYGLKLPKFVLDLPIHGCINIHVSLLPRWRGAAPIEHALLNGDKKTGISIFKLVEEMDAGPIIVNQSIEVSNNINKDELIKSLNIVGIRLLNFILPNIFEKKITYSNQNNKNIIYAPKITTEMRKLDFNQTMEIIHNKIRAFANKPSAWFYYNNERIKIIEADFVKGKWTSSIIINDLFHIGCKDGKMCPKIIQREGRKPLELENFLRGFVIKINSKINV
jgi:methionyl-tRNA formyltransferase